MGNRTLTMVIPLPLSAAHEPWRALDEIREITTAAKADERSAGNVGFQFDIAISNVRLGGPHEIAGAPVSDYLATAPLQGENRLLTVGLSYNDDFTITFTADAAQFADVEVMAAHTRDAFALMTGQPGPGG